jgi:hypothetical protein
MSTQIGLRGTIFLSVFINKYGLVGVAVEAVAILISLNAASLILCLSFISRRRSPLATSSVILCSTESTEMIKLIIMM